MNSNAAEALKKWREENGSTKRVDPIEKAKQNPKSKSFAIRAYCYECCGGQRNEVTQCASVNCPLWPHRPWQKKESE